MTRDDIIRMAKEAGFEDGYGNHLFPPGDYTEEVIPVTDEIVRFAALVAAAEREACAEYVAQSFGNELVGGQDVAAAIRARSEEQPYATQAAMVESQTHGRMQIDPATGNVSIGAIRARGET